jgi:nucleoid-associated protein YgaU
MTTSSLVSARHAAVPSAIRPAAEKSVAHEKIETARSVRVKAGDTLWSIAAKFLGRGDKWQALAKGNPQLVNPAKIQVGAWLALPDETGHLASRQDEVATAPAPFVEDASASVKVERGDSLWKVAKVKLGNGEAWKCVARANREIQNSDRIFPGQILTVPASCGGDGSQIADSSQGLSSAFSKRAALAVQAMRDDQR